MLSNNNKVLGVLEVSSGGITGTIVDLRITFSALLKAHATAFLIVHNHPLGKLAPSDADRQIIKKLKKQVNYLILLF